ncbi:nitrogen fixation protein NifU [Streptomyces sp. NRRL B-1140]|uniref:NifU family protein n=1 Tax=Streptomyces sp. NRRL B-1140 TaxID=1415549 RepID=UPI0006ADDEF8|nr:NifU family protein [Streptomyces sp. NRRL B-1140]KOV97743.1 nitrogen fixation protein NifU [Streptomyces sp. NRRL B-1140]
MAEAAGARLADPDVEARLARLDQALESLEAVAGPTTRSATEAVALLTEVYGEALARVLDQADEALAERLADDELLGHLMVLHDIHPEPAERRAARAVERLRPAVQERGGDVEWAGVEGQVARVRLTKGGCGSGCGSGGSEVTDVVRAAVLAAAPELTAVESLTETPPAFVPLTTLTHRGAP